MLNVGDPAPDFEATDQNGQTWRLSEALQRGPVVLYFYPADFSPVCTAQACAIRDAAKGISTDHVQILGVSPQSAESHKRFAATFNLDFPLLSDTSRKIIRAYGVEGPLGFGVRRATFLIGTDGRISRRVVSDLFLGGHKALIEEVLKTEEKSA